MTTETRQDLIEVEPVSKSSAVEFQRTANDLSRKVDALEITNQWTYEEGAQLSKEIKENLKLAEGMQKKITDPINIALKAVKALFAPVLSTLEADKEIIAEKLVAYDDEQQRLQKEKEEKAQREAAAEEARLKKIKEDQEKAWRDKQEKAQKEADELAAAGKAEEAAKAQAVADKAGDKAEERAQQAAEVFVPAPVVAPTAQKPQGMHYQERWSGECTDLMALVKAVADGKAPITFLSANQPGINKQATATKNALQFPGIKFICTKTPVNRG